MSYEVWLVYFITVLFLCLTPGPNSLLALTNGVRYGVKKTAFSSVGCAAGSALIIGISISSLGVILAASTKFFFAIKVLGALYLIYLGINMIISKSKALELDAAPRGVSTNRLKLFLQGFSVFVTNPKALLFFIAFLPQFYNPHAAMWPQFIALAATFVVVEFMLELSLATLSSRFMQNYKSTLKLSWFNRITGGVFIVAGGYLFTLQKN